MTIDTDACPVEIMSYLKYCAEKMEDGLVTQGFDADVVADRIEDAPEDVYSNYDGADPLLWSGC